MINRRIIVFLIIFHISPSGSKAGSQRNSFLLKLINHTQISRNESVEENPTTLEVNHTDVKCKHKCIILSELATKIVGKTQARFIDQDDDSLKNSEMEALAGKFSIFNLLPDDEEEDDNHDDDGDGSVKDVEEKEENESNENDINFFGSEEDIGQNQSEGMKHESLLKQYHRQALRIHNFMFPLLLAYKLKFFTVIPLLLGSLILLVGTTGVAGFFFALFAAALGIHVKAQEP